MSKVTLRQGIYVGATKDKTHFFHGVPYARPFTKRFGLPQPLSDSHEKFSVTALASNYPQLPSRLAFLNGNWHPSTKYDEKSSTVLSVYAPENNGSADPLPVIVWVHGGAWVTGGSQLSNYDGTKLAQDAGAVVVCINYRLGTLGFLYNESRSLDNGAELPASIANVVAAFEWICANIHAFGGNPSNVTSMGQSAGAYTGITAPPSLAAKIREEFIAYLPDHTVLENVPVEALLQAQRQVMAANSGLLAPWAPTTSIVTGFEKPQNPAASKQILIGWTATDGKVFSHMASPETPVSQLSNILTDQIFRDPSIALANQLREQGHTVTTFELTWAPQSFAFGPTHCIDLPSTFGFEAWSRSSMCLEKDRDKWEARGKRWRQRLGDFAKDGAPFVSEDGIKVF